MRTALPLALLLVLAAIPTASAGPLREACETVADNPWAPQPIHCAPLDDVIADPSPTLESLCRKVADNPWVPLLLECEF